MEPLSITVGCVGLISAIGSTSSLLVSFVRNCRAARHDLDDVSRELTSVEHALSLLKDDTATNNEAIPETLRIPIFATIYNCGKALEELRGLLQRHSGRRIDQAASWAMTGRHDADRLRSSLAAHKANLNLILEMLMSYRIRRMRYITTEIQNDTTAIRQDTTQILDCLNNLLSPGESRTQGSNLILDRYFDDIHDAETIRETWNDSDSGNHGISESWVPSLDSDTPSPSQELVQVTPNLSLSRIQRRKFSIFGSSNSYPRTLKGHDGWVLAIAFSPNGKLIASASRDCTVRLWDLVPGRGCMQIEVHSSCVRDVAFSPDGLLVASASLDNTIGLWDVATDRCYRILENPHNDSVLAITFSPDGRFIASSSKDCTIKLWDTVTGKNSGELVGHNKPVWAVAFSPDGNLLASASLDGTVKLWDSATRQHRGTFEGHRDAVQAVAFSPDSTLVASASYDRTVKLWDPVTLQVRRTFRGHSNWVQAVAFSPDGKLVASASIDNTVRLWDVASGRGRGPLVGHKDSVQAVAFSPDGKFIASSSNDGTIKLWDLAKALR